MKLKSFFKSLKRKRREKRFGLRVMARDLFLVEFKRDGKIMFDKGFGCDLSLSGAKFNTLIPFQKNEMIRMVLRFSPEYPGPHQAELAGKIVRSLRAGKTYYRQIACQFVAHQEKPMQILKNFLESIQTETSRNQKSSLSHCRRTVRRIQARDAFLMEFQKGGKKILHKGYGCDLSPLGASFMTLAPLRKQEKLKTILHFSPQFPGPKNLELDAEVIRTESSKNSAYAQAACRFHDPKGLARWIIRQFLDWVSTSKAKNSK